MINAAELASFWLQKGQPAFSKFEYTANLHLGGLQNGLRASRLVIATRVGGVAGMFGETAADATDSAGQINFNIGERGTVVSPENAAAFAAGILHVLRNEDLRLSLGEKGLEFVQQPFCKDRLVFDMQSLYAGLMKAH